MALITARGSRTHARSGIPLDSWNDWRTTGNITRKPDVVLRRRRDLFSFLSRSSAALNFAWPQ